MSEENALNLAIRIAIVSNIKQNRIIIVRFRVIVGQPGKDGDESKFLWLPCIDITMMKYIKMQGKEDTG
ncbi:hypothetical protein JZK55_12640 [Dissulfurispira thermophila]|uniref:Uncharacterized protein n=2 Tax=root TaxID=1 RepID=A0A7G1H2C7_9BACT|nr:hypothetical protein [Dissulfurispira thermophila]BCB96342.1 hypothetical protein JZK55_12640 [Dissulfurispira thermophila]